MAEKHIAKKSTAPPIYTITTMYLVTIESGELTEKSSRTVGFMYSLEAAIDLVLNNTLDLYECGYYNYALVETVQEGLYNIGTISVKDREVWFRWEGDVSDGGYKRIDKPECFEHIINFSIG